MTTIALDRLTKRYPRQPAPVLHHLSLTVAHGELLALLGPSGSGKSTILKLIAGIDRPDAGDIRFDGRPVLSVPANRRGAVLMFQKAYLFPFATVADNIGFGLKVRGERKATIRAEVARMLDLVELPGMERRYPAQLSGGEQQRVALARALVIQPRVLLLDEPLSSLDPAVRQTLQDIICRIQRETKITTLLVTHDLHEAIAMSDRTALLLRGTIAACDTPDRLFQRPPGYEAARFVGISNFFEGQVEDHHLHTPLGALAIHTSNGAGPPRPARFAIRPEHVRLLREPLPHTLPGTVEAVVYRGEFTDYRVALGPQTIHTRLYQPYPTHQRGDPVHVLFPSEHLFEIPEE
jgi:putative spermidine/putrescine transport system ATP-binding protein